MILVRYEILFFTHNSLVASHVTWSKNKIIIMAIESGTACSTPTALPFFTPFLPQSPLSCFSNTHGTCLHRSFHLLFPLPGSLRYPHAFLSQFLQFSFLNDIFSSDLWPPYVNSKIPLPLFCFFKFIVLNAI